MWSLYLDQLNLAVLINPSIKNNDQSAARLLIVSPEQTDTVQLVAQAVNDERFTMPVFCSDGALLYRVEQNGQYYLRRQKPGFSFDTLLTVDFPFQPLVCP